MHVICRRRDFYSLTRTMCPLVLMKTAVEAELDAEISSQVKPIRPEGSEGTRQALTSLLQSTHSHVDTHTPTS